MSKVRQIISILTHDERKKAIGMLMLMFGGMLLEMLGVGLVIPIIGLLSQESFLENYPVLGNIISLLGNPSRQELIIGSMIALVGVFVVKNIFLGVMVWLQAVFVATLTVDMSQRLFTIYLRQPYTFHLQHNSAELIRNVGGEVSMFSSNILMPGMLFVSEIIVLLGICGLLMTAEFLGTLIVVTVLGVVSWGFYRLIKKHITRWGRDRQHHEGMRAQHLFQGLGGAKDVKLLGREKEFLEQYEFHNSKSARMNLLQNTLLQFPRLWLELIAVLGLVFLILIMFAQGKESENIMPILGLFAAAAFRLMPSINRILSSIQRLRYGIPVIDVLQKELALGVSCAQINDPDDLITFDKSISLNDVDYLYPGSASKVLMSISFEIKKCTTVGFIGSSGSGKSTLIDIILGLLSPVSGNVAVDGKDIQKHLRSWQDQIGYVPQTIYLTDDSLRRNVAFGLPDGEIDDVAVKRAIKDAQLNEFVESLPDGLETMVGERGVKLSGGQRQRIGIARALYHNPVVLVLDEATSALDADTEKDVMNAVMALHGSKTIMIVAHRLSTIQNCDVLFRLEKGRIVGEGPPTIMLNAV